VQLSENQVGGFVVESGFFGLADERMEVVVVEKLVLETEAVIPLMAALPYGVAMEAPAEIPIMYDPKNQLSRVEGRNYSTCRYDESAGGLFSSKSDTQKDD